MIAADEDALICDFAETYHVYDYRKLPLTYAAILANGLRDDSRIKCKLMDQRVSTDTLLRAASVDALNLLVWLQTKDARKGRNRPASVFEKLTAAEPERNIVGFVNAEAFEKAHRMIVDG